MNHSFKQNNFWNHFFYLNGDYRVPNTHNPDYKTDDHNMSYHFKQRCAQYSV